MIPAETIPRAATVARSSSGRLLWGRVLVRLTVPLAVWAAGSGLAVFALAGGVETEFLARWAAAVLAVVAWVAPAPARELGWGAVLATLILWVLPPDPTRGAALGLLLVAILALATARAVQHLLAQRPEGRRGATTLLALALGWHLLFASGALALGELTLTTLLLGPVLAGGALAELGRSHGRERALIAGAAVLVACQGFEPVAGVCLGLLAAAEWLRRRGSEGTPWNETERDDTAGHDTLRGGTPWLPAVVFTATLVGILVALPFVWAPTPGSGFVPASAAVGRLPLLLPMLLPAAFLAVAWRAPQQRPRGPALATLGLALVMAWIVAGALQGGHLAAALPWAAVTGWLAWPVALAALTLPKPDPRGPRHHTSLLRLQRGWSGLLLAAAAVPAAYPWLRGGEPEDPGAVAVTVGALGLDLAPGPALGVVAVFAGLAYFARWDPRLPAAGAIAVLALLAVFHLPPAPLAVATGGGRVLTAEAPGWQLELPGEPAGAVILDSLLTHSAGLEPGTPVATVALEEATLEGAAVRRTEWHLAAGLDTGEWAAARADVAAHTGIVAPRAWISWLERDTLPAGTGRFLARRYRTRLTLDSRHPGDRLRPRRLTVTRRPDLPTEVQLTLLHGEVRP